MRQEEHLLVVHRLQSRSASILTLDAEHSDPVLQLPKMSPGCFEQGVVVAAKRSGLQ